MTTAAIWIIFAYIVGILSGFVVGAKSNTTNTTDNH